MFAEVDVLLSVEQFSKSCHQPIFTMYCDSGSLVHFGRLEIDTSSIICVAKPPSAILTWDHVSGTLERISVQVVISL